MDPTAVTRSCECLDLHKLLCVADVYVLIIIYIGPSGGTQVLVQICIIISY